MPDLPDLNALAAAVRAAEDEVRAANSARTFAENRYNDAQKAAGEARAKLREALAHVSPEIRRELAR